MKRPKRKHAMLVKFLDQADDAYMLAFKAKNIKPFIPYADPAVCAAISEEILSGEDRYFGTANLRKRTWEVVLEDGRTIQAVKHVEHQPIKNWRGISMRLGDDITQAWDIVVDGVEQFTVVKIRRVANDA